jgi:HEXXH motif-containing protein
VAALLRPNDLTVPGPESTTTRTVLSAALGRVCRELPGVVRAHGVGALREDAQAIGRQIAAVAKQAPGAIASVLRRPHTSTLVRVLRSTEPGAAPELAAELFALVAFDLAWLGMLSSRVTLRHLPPRFVSLTARGALSLPHGSHGATFGSKTIVCERGSSSESIDLESLAGGGSCDGWARPYRPVGGEIQLALADNNPLSGIEAHPEKVTPNTVDLGGRGEVEWTAGIGAALSTIEKALPGTARDVHTVLQQVVPTGFDAEKHLSCSYQEDVGTIYLSLHPSALTMAEAVVHEVSHNKLNALFDLDPVIYNGRQELYASPVRPDPRPIHGVLLAVHAFVPVACMYEALLADSSTPRGPGEERSLRERFAAVVRSNRAGTEVLRQHARPTPVGEGLLAELFDWDQHFRARG